MSSFPFCIFLPVVFLYVIFPFRSFISCFCNVIFAHFFSRVCNLKSFYAVIVDVFILRFMCNFLWWTRYIGDLFTKMVLYFSSRPSFTPFFFIFILSATFLCFIFFIALRVINVDWIAYPYQFYWNNKKKRIGKELCI